MEAILPALKPTTRGLLASFAGAMLPLSMAPLDYWPLALLAPAILNLLLRHQSRRDTALYCGLFGLGMFAVGASWVYVSIHYFGQASMLLALTLTTLFVSLLALLFTLPFLLLPNFNSGPPWRFCLAFTCLWVLGEWLRSWIFTGFPWLLIGYSQLPTPLSGWAPVGGIFLVSALTVGVSSAVAAASLCCGRMLRPGLLLLAAITFLSGRVIDQLPTTTPQGEPVDVVLVQPNIPQERKWDPGFLQETLRRLMTLSEAGTDARWVFWPEAAVPLLYHQALPVLDQLNQRADIRQQALITGILYDQPQGSSAAPTIYNSLLGLGSASGNYFKTRLVPFGEYVPLESVLRGLFDFFNLPTSIISAGESGQPGLTIGADLIAAAICYEIAYPDLVARNSRDSVAILTVSNDAWFGRSWGPLQHLQIAQMRARETGRYVIRATNNGVSAIINQNGIIEQRSPQFQQHTLNGQLIRRSGNTLFMQTGSYPTIISAMLILAALFRTRSATSSQTPAQVPAAKAPPHRPRNPRKH